MADKISFNSNELGNTIKIALLFSFRMLGLFMVFPVLEAHSRLHFEATPLLIGIALGIYGLSQAALQIPFGLLSDKYGRKKLIGLGLLFFIVGSVIAGSAENIYQLIFGRAVQGCGAIASVLLAYLADLTRAQVRIRAMATVGMGIGFSFVLSLILGPIFYEIIGMAGIFYCTAVLGCVGFLLLFVIKPAQGIGQEKGRAKEYKISFSAIKSVWKIKALWGFNIIVMSIHSCITLLFLFIPALLVEHHIALAKHWQVYLLTMLASLLMALPLIIWTEKKQRIRAMLIFSLLLLLLTLGLFMGSDNFIFLSVALTLFFVSFNVLEALLPSSVSRVAPLQYRGMALGMFSTHQFFGAFIGGSLGGLMLQQFGLVGLLFSAMGLVLFCLTCVFILPSNLQQRSQTITVAKNQPSNELEQWAKTQPGVFDAMYQPRDGALNLKTDFIHFNSHNFYTSYDKKFSV
jgi:MFS family permease